jgi:hypothetical protein
VSSKKRIWFKLIGMVCFAGLIVYFAPSVIGPMIDDYINQSELDQSLAACRPDELRFQLYYEKHGEEGGTFDFKNKRLSAGDTNSSTHWSLSGENRGPVFSAPLGYGKVFTDEDTQHIKDLLASLPPPGASAPANSYRDQIHLAFYQGGQLRIYHYPRTGAPPQLTELCKALGIAEHAN